MEKKAKPRIASLRDKSGLTQLELSRLVGVTETTIQNWESGRTGTDQIERIIKFCKALGCQVEELIEYVEAPSSLSDVHKLLGTDKPSATTNNKERVTETRSDNGLKA
ncbi:MAG: helix-turn-helix domain-containing protein [Cyanosarcina radialis HA8281-LM2]|jgi:transcriptional regulator with XRE-family HTH domain|nr:helix-turn-helix domain-containing protein [Cyanosarcina radialis HA8281-LM2]